MRNKSEGSSGHRGGRSGHGGGRHGEKGIGGGRGRHHHGRGGRNRHRVIDSGELRLLLMKLLEETPRHGYELIQEVDALTGGAYAPSPGMVYPTLTLLQDMEQISEVPSVGPRKSYNLTEQGISEIAEQADEIEALLARLSALKETQDRVDGGPVNRAMDNLKRVLITRLGDTDVEKDTLHNVAGILDDAAQRIERL